LRFQKRKEKNHSLKGLKGEVALREVPHQGLNHDKGTSWLKWNSMKTVSFWRFMDKRKEWKGKERKGRRMVT